MSGFEVWGWGPLRVLLVAAASALFALPASAAAATYPAGFQERVVADDLLSPTAVDYTPDGRMYVIEKEGKLRLKDPGAATSTKVVLDISDQVNSASDRGLLGLAVDSQFAQGQRYVYLLYTYDLNRIADPDEYRNLAVSQLARVPIGQDYKPSGPAQVILGTYTAGPCPAPSNTLDCIPSDGSSHSIGTVRSAPDGTLFVGSGDAADFEQADPLALRTYDERSLAGKIMRVDRNGQGIGSAGGGHSFCPTETNLSYNCTKLWGKGFRNPYRFSLRPGGGVLVGDVGWNQREEINVVPTGGKNYGWPCFEGGQRTPDYRELSQCQTAYAAGGQTAPDHEYLHPGVTPPAGWTSGERGKTALGGPTYTGSSYPASYDGDAFYGDFGAQTVRRLKFGQSGQVSSTADFATDTGNIVGLEKSPAGNLVMVHIGSFGISRDGEIREVVYTPNRAPVARPTATPRTGTAPLAVQLDGTTSSDPDGDALTYEWDFGDGSAKSTAARPPVHTYSRGAYTAKLTVTDSRGDSHTASVGIAASETAPTATIAAPLDESTYRGGQTVTLTGSGTDTQDGTLGDAALRWTVTLHHDDHQHPLSTSTGRSSSFTARDDHDADSYYDVTLVATDSAGLTDTKTIQVRPRTTTVRLRSTPTGAPMGYGGRDVTAPYQATTAVGYKTSFSADQTFSSGGLTWAFDRWSDDGSRVRSDVIVPDAGIDLTASYLEDKARGRTATAASASSTAGRAVDGDATTSWTSSAAAGQWWQVDLGRNRSVNQIQVDWGARPSQYTIKTSKNGSSWSDAAIQTTPTPSQVTRFDERVARYVRIAPTAGDTFGVAIAESRVLGGTDDTTPPDTRLDNGPPAITNDSTPTFTFSTVGTEREPGFECRFAAAAAWQACSSPFTPGTLADGSYTFQVRAIDETGNADQSAATRSFTIDTTAPRVSITSGPSGATSSRSARFEFQGSEQALSFECRLDGGAWITGCTSPREYTGLTEGAHTFDVRAKDGGGNQGPAASSTFTVDTTAPTVAITAGPSGTTSSNSARFEFEGSEQALSFECRLDGGDWQTGCSSPREYSGLADGPHTFEARAIDAAANRGPAASRSFTTQVPAPSPSPSPAAPVAPVAPAAPVRPVTPAPTGQETSSEQKPAAKRTYASTVKATRGLVGMFGLGDAGRNAKNAKGGRSGGFRGSPQRAERLVRSGVDGRARAFDGRDDRVELPTSFLGRPRRMSLELWVRASGSTDRARTLLSYARSERLDGITLRLDRAGRPVVRVVGTNGRWSSTRGPALGRRVRHLVVTYDGVRVRLYVDGGLTGTIVHRHGIRRPAGAHLILGTGQLGDSPFRGRIDEVAFYDRPLSRSTVERHHSAGR